MSDTTPHTPPHSTPPSPNPTQQNVHELEQQRRVNRSATEELGFDPYGQQTGNILSLAQARALFDPDADANHKQHAKDEDYTDARPIVTVAGRVMLHRDTGKLLFMNIRDATGDLQLAISKRDCTESGFKLAKITDLADIVVATGPLTMTRTGEITVWATDFLPASKSIVPPPEKWAGLQDVELRSRQRYIDLWANPDSMQTFLLRSKIISRIRHFMDSQGFIEVTTPTLQSQVGGAAARPFITHMNALDIDLFLSIAPELFLKRLLVGGMHAVYEISRNFRNEGVDRSHNPEFTMIEMYQAFGSYNTMMDLTESLIRDLVSLVIENTDQSDSPSSPPLTLPYGDLQIDYAKPFTRIIYAELFEQAMGFSISDTKRARAFASSRNINCDDLEDILVISRLFDEFAEDHIDPASPTFVVDFPAALCPLTKSSTKDPRFAERFELFIGGMELANAYTELNNPDIQEEKFRQQLQGINNEDATFRTLDKDFIHALKVGMPPAGGNGIGIDRLVMLLTNQHSIRDVILFPFMRPLDD